MDDDTTQNTDDSDDLCSYQRKPGVYKSSCTIPPDTFGEKRFFVSLQLIYPKVEHPVLNKVLGFDVSFVGYNNVQYGSFKDSFLLPRLSWQTQPVVVESEPI